ncbi:aldose epimerase family protein [Rubellimicrobium aerolatum]|uniref:Aldose 1-epimerase n=1 Tax=Rubellimicrobium aerolatum TaxID=490979 RepID=A0ABW0SG91_9RHOB|nr:aldose epimerase family protein [Rubellimicrobium aerolatum]MBP1807366.1 aldose 1-epimerase [Rubellimicrobium aerolatum]
MAVTEFGRIGDQIVQAVTLSNGGLRARLITYGARLTELHVPGRDGRTADIVLGFDTLDDYLATTTYFGATCGRYANRIRRGRFTLDGTDHQLDLNEGPNHLHGGRDGFDRKTWTLAEATATRATFTATSLDGEMGYPGACDLRTTYELTPDARLLITMEATATAPTPVNIVHHSYFNLAGQGDVLGQHLRLAAPFTTPVDSGLLATGEVRAVAGTPFDFTTPKPIGQHMSGLGATGTGDDPQPAGIKSGPETSEPAPPPPSTGIKSGLESTAGYGNGYDHNWVLGDPTDADGLRACAEALDPASGRRLLLRTDQPGVQLYAGGYLTDSIRGKNDTPLRRFAGFTLETQRFPGSPNHPHFPDSTLRPGDKYLHRMEFSFSADA